MGNISDETLMAFADGELTREERKAVATAIANNPAIQERLVVFTSTRDSLTGLFDAPMHQPIPEAILSLLREDSKTTAQHNHYTSFAGNDISADPVSFENLTRKASVQIPAYTAGRESLAGKAGQGSAPEARQSKRRSSNTSIADFLGRWLPSGGSVFAAAAAMGLALVTGAVLGWQLRQPNLPAASQGQQFVSLMDGQLVAGGNFAKALSQVAMGQQSAWPTANGDKLTLKPLSTFRTTNNGVCRQYQLAAETGASFAGVACRSGQNWQIPMHVASGAPAPSGEAIRPASGGGNPVIDKFVDQLIDGDVFDPADEAALIKGGWTQKK